MENMHSIPAMVMIGGNSRNSGKTTLACKIIKKLSTAHDVIGLKVTSIRPQEEKFHGNHAEEVTADYTIYTESDSNSDKDTSKMLKAGASRVFYIRATDIFLEKALLHFVSMYINNQVIVCESRSLRKIVKPGLFLMMMKLDATSKTKDVSEYLSLADKVFYHGESHSELDQFIEELDFEQGNFIVANNL